MAAYLPGWNGGNLRLIFLMAVTGIAAALSAVAATPEEEASVIGEKWLALLDDQKYEESWTQASNMFRGEVPQERWVAALKQSRAPLGSMVSRTTARVDFTKTLRGAPDGDYAIIHFTTNFKNKSDVTERLTLVKEDGKWRASAYAIH
jgi:hypothetical protein